MAHPKGNSSYRPVCSLYWKTNRTKTHGYSGNIPVFWVTESNRYTKDNVTHYVNLFRLCEKDNTEERVKDVSTFPDPNGVVYIEVNSSKLEQV